MREIKIFALPSHTFIDKISGVDYVRIIQPMRFLNGFKYNDVKFKVIVYDHSKNRSFDWRDVFAKNDIVYFNYTSNDVGYAVMGLLAQKYNKKLVCDLDDDLFNILGDNPAYEVFKPEGWGRVVIKAILGDVSHVTCTNQHLKHSIAHYTEKDLDKIGVLPNYIDLDLYKHRCKFKDRGFYVGLHFGSTTHFRSLYDNAFVEALDMIMKEYPNFTFKTVGAFIPDFRNRWGVRYQQIHGHQDLLKWIKKMPAIMKDADFMIVPLVNNAYNKSKSSIKYLEASSYKIPGCYQHIRQYAEVIHHKHNGLLCSGTEEWYKGIKLMLDNAELRKTMGTNAFKTIEKGWQIKDNLKEYAEFFIKVLDKS